MIRTMICSNNHPLRPKLPQNGDETMWVDGEDLVWLDLFAPTPEELQHIAASFHLHTLVVDDISKRQHRPKIEIYEDHYFMVFYDIDYVEDGDLLDEHQLSIVLGKGFFLTIHYDPIEEISQVAARFRRNAKEIERGIGVLLYSLLDTIIDHYFPVLDRIGDRIDQLETQVLAPDGAHSNDMQDIFSLKRELVHLRRQIAPQRDALAILARRELPIISETTVIYFQDLYEHVLRVTDTIDVDRDLLSGVLDAYLSANSNSLAVAANNLNNVMKRLTAFSIILMSVTLIAGIYGMNFDGMPELHWKLGYPFALGMMVIIAGVLAAIFKRLDWF